MAVNTLKRIGVIMLIIGGSLLTEPGFANTAGSMALLIGGLIGGYMDGVRRSAAKIKIRSNSTNC